MNTEAIIEQIDAEISKLQQAKILLLNGVTATSTKRAPGRPKNSAVAARILSVTPAKPIKKVVSSDKEATKTVVPAKTAKAVTPAKTVTPEKASKAATTTTKS